MKPLRVLISLVLMALSTAALAQSDAQKAFDQLKNLAGTWEATFEGKPMHATLRVTSMGSAIIHEMKGDSPEDPISMIHLDGDRLILTHYCDAGNQPRFVGKLSPDGKTIDFTFLDVTNFNSTQEGHMQHVVFTFADPSHHTEQWSFLMKDGKKMDMGHLDLHRVN